MSYTMTPFVAVLTAMLVSSAFADEVSLESAPPVIVKTIPVAGTTGVDPGLAEIRVTYSKPMQDGSWSWCSLDQKSYPTTTGDIHYLPDGRTCVLPVKLDPERYYAIWLNVDRFQNFKDKAGHAAVPYLLTFSTGPAASAQSAASGAEPAPAQTTAPFNADQRRVMEWTENQFRSLFDARTFAGLSAEERTALETRLLDTLKGPQTREYYEAISTLGALRSTRAVPALRDIAFERVDRNNRDRWMAIRSLGMIGDKSVVPELIHLVYHGNVNTHWWAQIALVQLTGQNFAKDWNAWGKWWNEQGGEPKYDPTIIRWWSGQPEPDKLAESLEESDRKFFASLSQ